MNIPSIGIMRQSLWKHLTWAHVLNRQRQPFTIFCIMVLISRKKAS